MKELLKKWILDNDLINKVEHNFWECLEAYKCDEKEEYLDVFPKGEESINTKLGKVAFELSLPDFDEAVISIYVDIYEDSKYVGWYKELYLSTGELLDEFFVIDVIE